MRLSRSIFVASLSLLLRNVLAMPFPMKNMPEIGSIVSVAPQDTNGGPILSAKGGALAHPHVVTGHGSNGQVHLAPASHTDSEAFEPKIDAKTVNNKLEGSVHVGEVTAHRDKLNELPTNHPLHGVNVGASGLKAIGDAKDGIKQNAYQEAHTKAAKSHQDAADTHAKAQRANVAAAATMTKQGKTPAAEKHTANAGVHEQQEQTHMAAAANHLENAKTHHSLGPSAEDAMKSSAKAQMSQSQASTSARNANNVANAKPKRKTLI